MSGSDAQIAFVCQECGTGLLSAGTPHSLDDCRAAWPELKAELERARDEIRELRSALSTAHIDGAESDQIAEQARSERDQAYAALEAARIEIEQLKQGRIQDIQELDETGRMLDQTTTALVQERARTSESARYAERLLHWKAALEAAQARNDAH